MVDDQRYGGIDRTTRDWWRSPPGEYTEEELEILRRILREAEASLTIPDKDG